MLTVVFFFLLYRLYHLCICTCNFICGLSDVKIKTFSQSVSPSNSTHYLILYPQNGDRIVTLDTVMSHHPIYSIASANKSCVSLMRCSDFQFAIDERVQQAICADGRMTVDRRKCGQQNKPSANFVDNRVHDRRAAVRFSKSRVPDIVPKGSTLIWKYLNFLETQHP